MAVLYRRVKVAIFYNCAKSIYDFQSVFAVLFKSISVFLECDSLLCAYAVHPVDVYFGLTFGVFLPLFMLVIALTSLFPYGVW